MIKLGFLLSNTGTTQLSYHVIKNVNDYVEVNQDLDVIAFYDNTTKPWLIATFGFMNISEAYNFDGAVVATNLENAAKLSRFPGPSSRYFLVWDFEWLRNLTLSYEEMRAVYRNPRLKILVRTQEQAQIFESCWNRPVDGVIGDVSLKQLLPIIRKDQR